MTAPQVWNTSPLTQYFNCGMHLYEVNTTNPLGTKGMLATRFGELCKEVMYDVSDASPFVYLIFFMI